MGTVRVTRQTSSALSESQLKDWFQDQLEDMAYEKGKDSYCGNWNCNEGLCITNKTFKNESEANAYFAKELERRGPVLAVRIGDFSKAWPFTKEQKTLVQRLEELETEELEFEYRILERAKKQKSKTKKCVHCESGINVHKLQLPKKSELTSTARYPDVYACRSFGRLKFVSLVGLTDCPVCHSNLLRTDTDNKNEESLKRRLAELRTKVARAKAEFDKAQAGKPKPYWLVAADCAS